jgi:hypothetical protein
MNLISYMEPQWDDEEAKQIASTLTPEQTDALYAEARQLLNEPVDVLDFVQPNNVRSLIRDLADIDRLFKR